VDLKHKEITDLIEVGLLLNFGPKAEYRRKIYDNDLKGNLSWYKAV
jgi:hypothetical protein